MKRFVVLLAFPLFACTTGGNIASLHQGMTRDQVISTLGSPDGARTSGRTEQLVYASRYMSGWSWDKADYQVTLVDGVVAEYGPTRVLTAGPPQPALGAVTVFQPR